MSAPRKLTTKTLTAHAWASGFRGTSGLAKRLGRRRETLYRAIRDPRRYRPTHDAILSALGMQ